MENRGEDMNEVLISVIVPVYNIREDFLKRCLCSMCEQSLKRTEFIVVDDGSTDDSGKICDEYSTKDSRIKVIHCKNQGVSNTRNVGIENSKGKYIIFVDGDDFIEPNTCEICYQQMEKYNYDLMYFKYSSNEIVTNTKVDDIITNDCPNEEIKDNRILVISHREPYPEYSIGSPWGKVFKRDIIENNNIKFVYGLKKCQDRVFVFDYMEYVKTMGKIDYIGYHYIDNPFSITRKYNKNIGNILFEVENQFEKRIDNQSNSVIEYKNAFYTMCLSFLFTILKLDVLNEKNNSSIALKYKEIKRLINKKRYSDALKYGNLKELGKRKMLLGILLKCRLYVLATVLGNKILK